MFTQVHLTERHHHILWATITLVSAPYRRDNIPVGSVGILDPTRMMYENAIAVVEAAADYLSEALS